MKQEPKGQFVEPSGDPGITILQAITQAKDTIIAMTGLHIDSVAQCRRSENLNWAISVDVIESAARMGDNDLLATYEVEITPTGDMQSFSRTRRYHREDRDA
ncbi:MAG: gas vesicle protein GvpO [Pseudomonadota bacterium]